MLFQKILDSVSENVDMDYTYKELQDDYIGLLIPTGDNDPSNAKILHVAHNFLGSHVAKNKKYFTPWYDTFRERGVRIIETKMKPYLKAYDRFFYYFLLPNTIHSNELAFFCDQAGEYMVDKNIISKKANKLNWFNPRYKIPGKDFTGFEKIKNFDPVEKYKIKSKKTKDLFGDILSEEDYSYKDIYFRRLLHVPSGENKITTKKYASQIQDFLKNSEVKVITAKARSLLAGEEDRDHYFILFPKGFKKEQIHDICMQLQNYFILLGHATKKDAKDWFSPHAFTGVMLRRYFTDFTIFDPMSEYNMSSSKAKDVFKDILESTDNKKIYSKSDLNEFDKHSLYSNRKDANFVHDFLQQNPKFKNDFKIVVRKKKTMPAGFTLIPDDMFFILLRKTQNNYYHARLAFSLALDKAHLDKHGVPFFYDYRHVKFDKASSISNLGKIEDYDPLDAYEIKQKTQDLFGDILKESLSKTSREVIPKNELANSTSAFISTQSKSVFPKWFYDFIHDVNVSRYNLDFDYFKDVGVKVGYHPEMGWYSIIIPNKIFDDEVSRSVFNIELDMFLKRKGVRDQEREMAVKNLYMPANPKEIVHVYHPLMDYEMKSNKAKETFKDII